MRRRMIVYREEVRDVVPTVGVVGVVRIEIATGINLTLAFDSPLLLPYQPEVLAVCQNRNLLIVCLVLAASTTSGWAMQMLIT